jgi:putative ABC transport system permease protein
LAEGSLVLSSFRHRFKEGAPIREAFIIGYRSLSSHKLRSFLTMLGMIFGVAAVIAMMAIGEGAKQESLKNLSLLGANNLLVDAIDQEDLSNDDLERKSPGLCLRDMRALQTLLPDCQISAQRTLDVMIMAGRSRLNAPLAGVDPMFLQQSPGFNLEGRWFTELDQLHKSRVCVLGSEIADELFGRSQVLHSKVKIAGQWFRVIGVLGSQELEKAASDELKMEASRSELYIPRETLIGRFEGYDPEHVDRLVISAPTTEKIPGTLTRVKLLFERRHHGARDIRFTVPYDLIRQQQATQRIFNLVMGAIASISLIVGGIGIMNIMLSSVIERTREIGIRRAVGATAFEVLLQFVLEAILLALGGGLLGVLLGFLLAWSISFVAHWPTQVPIWAVFLSFGVSVGTGLLFGIYPARRAAAMNPIEALRHE